MPELTQQIWPRTTMIALTRRRRRPGQAARRLLPWVAQSRSKTDEMHRIGARKRTMSPVRSSANFPAVAHSVTSDYSCTCASCQCHLRNHSASSLLPSFLPIPVVGADDWALCDCSRLRSAGPRHVFPRCRDERALFVLVAVDWPCPDWYVGVCCTRF